ncbi:hypothetical protein SAMN04488035_0731 [Flavimobilis marinus]|uniref:Uncharacterized protein n=1 Tax=Flavimobilis marinus TaxID=285351 RepID=A0A1I2DTM7_9MICO|nr:hypothetical protein [Flavimobilis marinus]SFE84012.1 hypothetical protein SAMN04488035_0731 [Flavimobilis marinus]
MRLRTLMSSVALAALVATGSVVAPAAAGGASAADPATPSSVTITVRDVKNKAGTYTLKRWATVDVKVPLPASPDPMPNLPLFWDVTVVASGGPSCLGPGGLTARRPYEVLYRNETHATGGGSWTIDLPVQNVKGANPGYLRNGTCTLTATLDVYRNADHPAGGLNSIIEAKTTYNIRSATKVTRPKASRTKVTKNKKVTLSGRATYVRADARYHYKHRSLKKGTRLVLQQKVKGWSKWRNVKTVKVGAGGKWKTKVKVRKTTSYRVVTKQTSTLYRDVSKARTVKVVRR